MRKFLVFCLGLLLLLGCATKKVEPLHTGKLTYKGKPVNNATLYLHPVGGKETAQITLSTDKDGNFEIRNVPPGEYKVVVEGSAGVQQANLKDMDPKRQAEAKKKLEAMSTPPTTPFPDKYKSPQTTTLKLTVTEKDSSRDLELTD